MPQHLVNHEERSTNYLREERRGGMCLNERYIEGNVVTEKEARERCFKQQLIKVLDREYMETRQRGEADHDLVADAGRYYVATS